MRVEYDRLDESCRYPLARADLSALQEVVESRVLDRVHVVRFGCNNRTTQEARLVGRGDRFDIRVNFATDQAMHSPLRSGQEAYLRVLEAMGGQIRPAEKMVTWSRTSAAKYAWFLILHEVGHILYAIRHGGWRLGDRSFRVEEEFCDRFALEAVEHLTVQLQATAGGGRRPG